MKIITGEVTTSKKIKSYTSEDQTLTAGGSITLTHGLGDKPFIVQGLLKCTTAEHGYSIGDEVAVDFMQQVGASAASYGMSCVITDTELSIRLGDATSTFYVHTKSSGAPVNITNTNWKLIVKALVV